MLKLFSNKVLLYVSTRYLVYGIQFLSLILVSSKLGQYRYGIWGFILMLLTYLNIINLGIPNSINVILIQNKKFKNKIKDYIASAFTAIFCLIGVLIIIGIIYSFFPERIFEKFNIGSKLYIILIVGALQYLNVLMVNIFRASNKLIEVALYQSSVPIGIFIAAISFSGDTLLEVLLYTYLIMNVISLLMFLLRGKEFWGGKASLREAKAIAYKGFFLFLYNACFYLIVTSTSTLVSNNYKVEQYGDYSFSYTLGHSILLIMEAFMYILFPKIVDKFYSGSDEEIDQTLNVIRTTYISVSHLLVLFALAAFPILIKLFPNFKSSLICLNFMMLAIALSTNAFGYNTLLIARNKEKLSATISGFTLMANIIIGWTLIHMVKVPYYYVPVTIMLSYLIFANLCGIFAHKTLNRSINLLRILLSVMPIRIAIPYILAILLSAWNCVSLLWIPIMVYGVLNIKTIKELINTAKSVINSPQIVDIDK